MRYTNCIYKSQKRDTRNLTHEIQYNTKRKMNVYLALFDILHFKKPKIKNKAFVSYRACVKICLFLNKIISDPMF